MTNNGDDCYFYYYSTCTKGDSCPFRHCEAAMGNETVCNLWQEGRCFRLVCKFRHMEIQKNRKEIPCYWENQPAGCQKSHCVFYHEKQRFIDGILVPPSKGPKAEELQHEEPAPLPAPLPVVTNPQLRGVLKAEAQETVPSPTHPPVVINPADDDEDEDDQFSEEGEDGKFGQDGTRLTSPRKLAGASNPTLNFGVSTLEEIRLRKALKASMKRAAYPVQSADVSRLKTHRANRENTRSHLHPAGFQAREDLVYCGETERNKNDISDRLGKRTLNKDAGVAGHSPRKRSLADRLGRVVEEQTGPPLRNGLKTVKDRLGFQAEEEAPAWPVQTPEAMLVSSEAPQQIRIKTLEEIRQEKASKSQNKKERVPASAPGSTTAKILSTKFPRGAKRSVTVKDVSPVQTKTFSSAKKKPEEDQQKPDNAPSPVKASQASERPTAKAKGPPDAGVPGRSSPPGADLRVKTLEEIRQEKAARLQAQQSKEAGGTKSPVADGGEDSAKKPGVLILSKPQVPSTVDSSTPSSSAQTKKTTEAKEKLVASEVNGASSIGVKVKTFEEIMREKRLRKQEMEEQASWSPCPSPGCTETEPPPKRPSVLGIKKTLPIKSQDVPPAATSPSSSSLQSSERLSTTPSLPVPKRMALKSKAVSPSAHAALTHSGSQSPRHLSTTTTTTAQGLNSCSTQVKQTKKMASQQKSPGQTPEIKVRPKLNVKPSVMKHAVQVKPGQKRRLAVRSAVAEVKPLNSTSTVSEVQLQEPQCKLRARSPAEESQPSPAVTQSPSSGPAVTQSPSSGPAVTQSPSSGPAVTQSPSSGPAVTQSPSSGPAVTQSPSSGPAVTQSPSSGPAVTQTPASGPAVTQSPAKEEPQTVPTSHHHPVQNLSNITKASDASMEACTAPQSPIMKTPTPVKPRRSSFVPSRVSNISSSSAVDEFDELMNEFTDDHLGEDMDPGMGEDDLLQELSEMIDS